MKGFLLIRQRDPFRENQMAETIKPTNPESVLHSAKTTVDYLNRLLEVDRNTVECLFDIRVPCNDAMRDHPTVQVITTPNGARVGLIGVLNGLFGVDQKDRGHICTIHDEEDNLLRFELTRDVL
jgi:hypothetical protein